MKKQTSSSVILSREEMYFYDKYTIEKLGVPARELMENAGKGCSDFIHSRLLKAVGKVAIFCGSGNNGGDGFVVARYLKNWEHIPTIFLVGDPGKMSPETAENFRICREMNIAIYHLKDFFQWQNLGMNLAEFDLIVDAIFGIGFKGTLRGWLADLIREINDAERHVVSIDIASGTDADTGLAEIAVNADYTLTMAAYKYGNLLGKGRRRNGQVNIIDIGIPGELFSKYPPRAAIITNQNVEYPQRCRYSHKGEYGRIGIIAGSPGYSGAAVMAARAALRAGAGMVTLLHPRGMEVIFETQLLEAMTYSLSETTHGNIDIKLVLEKLETMDVLLIGPGLGTSDKTGQLLKQILQNWSRPVVLDADALNIISQNRELLALIKNKPFLLTPHIGEFARLTNQSISDIIADPLGELEKFSREYNCDVLLKSSTTVFSNGKKLVFDITGNDGLATGGSGDVLAGIIVSFLGQKLSLEDAAVSASFLMGKTAEKLADYRKPASIIPSDIIEELFKY